MRDNVRPRVRGDYQQRNARTAAKRQGVWIVGDDLRRNVIVVTLGLVVGDDDGALIPVRAAGYGIDLARHQSFAQLRIRVPGVVIVASELCLDLGVTIERRQAGLVLETSPNVKYAAGSAELVRGDIREEVIQAMEVDADRRVSSDVAEIMRPVVVTDVAGVFHTVVVSWFCVVSLLIPAPFYGCLIQRCKVRDVILQIG